MAEKVPVKAATIKVASEKEVVQKTIKYLIEKPNEFETFQKNPDKIYGNLGLNIDKALLGRLSSYKPIVGGISGKLHINSHRNGPGPDCGPHINLHLNAFNPHIVEFEKQIIASLKEKPIRETIIKK